jgi:hypothetical protein
MGRRYVECWLVGLAKIPIDVDKGNIADTSNLGVWPVWYSRLAS